VHQTKLPEWWAARVIAVWDAPARVAIMGKHAFILPLVAAACAQFQAIPTPSRPTADRPPPPEEIAEVVAAPPPPAGARTVDQFDTTTAEQRAAATNAPPAAEAPLGQVVVSLGDPGEAGLWLETALVDAPRAGRVVAPGGNDAIVELRPGSGGARMSLAAMRLLDLPLTGLPTVTVYGR
jgi:hypothetical protein